MKRLIIALLSLAILSSCTKSGSIIDLISSNEVSSLEYYSSTLVENKSIYYQSLVGVTYGEVSEITYPSKVTGTNKHANVLLPGDYDTNTKYPVLYLLHGMLGNHYSWLDDCKANYIIANLNAFFGVPKMITVMVNCIVNETEEEPSIFSTDLTKAYDKIGEDIVTSLKPYIDENYSTLSDKDHTALAGYSLGGRETIYAGFNYQNTFGYLGAFSIANFNDTIISIGSSNPIVTSLSIDPSSNGFRYILLTVGRSDSMVAGVTESVDTMMNNSNIRHDFYYLSGSHNYPVWQESLFDYGLHLFGDLK